MAGPTHYDVLGVDPEAETTVVRRAYLALARVHHPDFHAQDSASARSAAEEQMRSINVAWDVLGDQQRRARYDRDLRGAGQPLISNGAAAARPSSRSSNGAAPSGASWHNPAEPEGSGTSPPRWLTMAPAMALVLAVACFAVGFVTGLVGLLAMGLGFALVGATMFVVVPMVALNRSKRG